MQNQPPNSNDKPVGASAGWHLRDSKYRYQDKMLKLRLDQVTVEGSGDLVYSYIEKAAGILIVPVTRDGQMVLIRQYRYPVDEWCLEIPAGGTHDTGAASLEEVARKELKEEIGATCTRLHHITSFYAEPSFSNELCHVFLADEVELSQEPRTEATERIEKVVVSIEKALQLARNGEMKSGPCTLAVLLCQHALEQLGFVSK